MTNPDLDALEAKAANSVAQLKLPLVTLHIDEVTALIAKAREVATLTAERDALKAERDEARERLVDFISQEEVTMLIGERDAYAKQRDEARENVGKMREAAERIAADKAAALATRDEQIAALKAALEECVREFVAIGEGHTVVRRARSALDALTANARSE